jgi:phospholipid/cholesterol/gamma-HCH transport system substrate-binding protein
VTLNGLEIGRVTQIVINESTGKLLVELQIKSNFLFQSQVLLQFTSLVLLPVSKFLLNLILNKSIAIEVR